MEITIAEIDSRFNFMGAVHIVNSIFFFCLRIVRGTHNSLAVNVSGVFPASISTIVLVCRSL